MTVRGGARGYPRISDFWFDNTFRLAARYLVRFVNRIDLGIIAAAFLESSEK